MYEHLCTHVHTHTHTLTRKGQRITFKRGLKWWWCRQWRQRCFPSLCLLMKHDVMREHPFFFLFSWLFQFYGFFLFSSLYTDFSNSQRVNCMGWQTNNKERYLKKKTVKVCSLWFQIRHGEVLHLKRSALGCIKVAVFVPWTFRWDAERHATSVFIWECS